MEKLRDLVKKGRVIFHVPKPAEMHLQETLARILRDARGGDEERAGLQRAPREEDTESEYWVLY